MAVKQCQATIPTATTNTFIGNSLDLGWGRVYGGQTMAQALSAVQQLVPDKAVHEFGCHFLLAGDVKQSVKFEADIMMSGRSFSVVHVRAKQEGVGVILSMSASLQTPEQGLEHQFAHRGAGLRKEWLSPDQCKSTHEYMQVSERSGNRAQNDELTFFLCKPYLRNIPETMRPLYEFEQPLEVRPTEFIKPWDPVKLQPTRCFWIKARQQLLPTNNQNLQNLLLTYISDWGLLETSVFPHPTGMWSKQMQMASLNHSIKFHRPFDLSKEWLCHAMHSPVSGGGRGYAVGEFWNERGELVASSSQEGLIRERK